MITSMFDYEMRQEERYARSAVEATGDALAAADLARTMTDFNYHVQ